MKTKAFILVMLLGLWVVGCAEEEPVEEVVVDNTPAKPLPGAMVTVPAGEFTMGFDNDPHKLKLAKPAHTVNLPEYEIDVYEVTNGEFAMFQIESDYKAEGTWRDFYTIGNEDFPVANVTWEDAKAYCEWSGARLPTEAEREKAARGTDGRKYPWGNEEPDAQRAVFRRNWGKEATAAVATHPAGASPYGLQDMGGNVWEWCSDWYDDDYYNVSPYTDPKGPSSGNAHVVRGGSWDSRPDVLSASCRSWGHRGYREGDFGFRCAMNIPHRVSPDPGFKQY